MSQPKQIDTVGVNRNSMTPPRDGSRFQARVTMWWDSRYGLLWDSNGNPWGSDEVHLEPTGTH